MNYNKDCSLLRSVIKPRKGFGAWCFTVKWDCKRDPLDGWMDEDRREMRSIAIYRSIYIYLPLQIYSVYLKGSAGTCVAVGEGSALLLGYIVILVSYDQFHFLVLNWKCDWGRRDGNHAEILILISFQQFWASYFSTRCRIMDICCEYNTIRHAPSSSWMTVKENPLLL